MPKAAALAALYSLLSSPGFVGTPGALEILETPSLDKARLGFIDRLIHAEYSDLGAVEMLTCERDAGRLSNVRVIG